MNGLLSKRNGGGLRVELLSIANSFLVMILCYFVDNSPYSFTGGPSIGQRIEQIKTLLRLDSDHIPDDVVIINVAYDRQLVDINDEMGLPVGNIDITDRHKLFKFLQQAQESRYKYIMLDVALRKDYASEYDSALYNQITEMRDIVIAKSDNFDLGSLELLEVAALSDYSIHIAESNFVKYEYIRNGEITMPYKAYLHIKGNKITKHGPFYFFNGRLARKSVILKFPITLRDAFAEGDINGNKSFRPKYLNLGADILDSSINIAEVINDKIVIIGDVTENDMHDTYLGRIAGPIINLNALYALIEDDLSYSPIELLILFSIYFIVSYFILERLTPIQFFPILQRRSNTFRFLISFCGLSTLFIIIGSVSYLIADIEVNILIPSLYFSILSIFVNYNHIRLKK